MFYSRLTPHEVKAPTEEVDELGFKTDSFTSIGALPIYLPFADQSDYRSNDLKLQEVSHVGYTTSDKIRRGMIIDDRYQVLYVVSMPPLTYTLYLKEIING